MKSILEAMEIWYNDTYFIKNIQSRTSSCMQTCWCGNHFLPEITRILHLVNLINVATNVNIAKQMCIPKRFQAMVSTYLKPPIHLQVIVFSKVFMQKLIKKFPPRSYVWETVDMLHASFNRFEKIYLRKFFLEEIFSN